MRCRQLHCPAPVDMNGSFSIVLLRAQVLATGLSGLYSSLPTKLDVPSEDWHCLHREDWLQMPSLVQFLNSLEFCNAVIQVGLHCRKRV